MSSERSSGFNHLETLPTIIRLFTFKCAPRGSGTGATRFFGLGGTYTGTAMSTGSRGSTGSALTTFGAGNSLGLFPLTLTAG